MSAEKIISQEVNEEYSEKFISKGLIAIWSGDENTIPEGWAICNGENGTPNLCDKFVVGASMNNTVNLNFNKFGRTLDKTIINKQILTTIKRRPCTAEDVSQILGFDLEKVQNHLDSLVERGEIKKKKMQRGLFYIAIKS